MILLLQLSAIWVLVSDGLPEALSKPGPAASVEDVIDRALGGAAAPAAVDGRWTVKRRLRGPQSDSFASPSDRADENVEQVEVGVRGTGCRLTSTITPCLRLGGHAPPGADQWKVTDDFLETLRTGASPPGFGEPGRYDVTLFDLGDIHQFESSRAARPVRVVYATWQSALLAVYDSSLGEQLPAIYAIAPAIRMALSPAAAIRFGTSGGSARLEPDTVLVDGAPCRILVRDAPLSSKPIVARFSLNADGRIVRALYQDASGKLFSEFGLTYTSSGKDTAAAAVSMALYNVYGDAHDEVLLERSGEHIREGAPPGKSEEIPVGAVILNFMEGTYGEQIADGDLRRMPRREAASLAMSGDRSTTKGDFSLQALSSGRIHLLLLGLVVSSSVCVLYFRFRKGIKFR